MSIFETIVPSLSVPFVPMTGPKCLRRLDIPVRNRFSGASSCQRRASPSRKWPYFLNIDFDNHVALIAEINEDGHPVIAGSGRYILVQPGQAEIAFLVVDAYQGQGIGTILMRHLALLARDAGLKELVAEVLPENAAMLKLFKKFGFRRGSKGSPQVVHLTMQLA